jgi:hypothetical protein
LGATPGDAEAEVVLSDTEVDYGRKGGKGKGKGSRSPDLDAATRKRVRGGPSFAQQLWRSVDDLQL